MAGITAGLLRTFLYGAPLVGLTYAVVRFVPGVPVVARVAAWWLVTVRLVLWLVPLPSIAVPVLPATSTDEVSRVGSVLIATGTSARAAAIRASHGRASRSSVTPPGDADEGVTALAATSAVGVAWASGLVVLGAVDVRRAQRMRRMLRAAAPAPCDVATRARDVAARLELTTAFDVRVSSHVRTPQVVGVRRPIVVLPAERLASLVGEELDMVLCHELVHVRHRDLWLGTVPAVARWLLFFNPLAHLVTREYSLAREAACDARVLEVLRVAPRQYGALLLSFAAASRPALAGSAAATGSFSTLSRRLMMLDTTPVRPLRRAAFAAPACAVFALLPLSPIARTPSVSPVARAVVARDAPAADARAPQTEAPAVPAAPEHDTIHVREGDRTSWVLFKEGDDSVHMNGSTSDVRRARAARHGREALLGRRAGNRV